MANQKTGAATPVFGNLDGKTLSSREMMVMPDTPVSETAPPWVMDFTDFSGTGLPSAKTTAARKGRS